MATDKVTPIRQNVSNLLSRMGLARLAGLMFDGKRRLYDVFGYPQVLTANHLLSKYQRQDIASRIVDMPPEEMWAHPPKLTEMRGVKEKWDDFTSQTQFYQRVIQVDKLLSFGPFAVLWVGMRGDAKVPAPSISSAKDILYIQAYGGENVKVRTYEDNTQRPRYGQPVLYEVKVGPENQQKTVEVHYSRLIHIVDRPLQGLMFGEPRLAQIYNTLDDILKVGGGSAELYWLTANRGMQVDVDKEMQLQAGDAEALEDELDEFQHQLRRYIRTRGVKVTPLGSEVADPRGVFETLVAILAGTTSIPQRILTGSEAGQLASEQDRANWAEYIERRRRVFGEPYILNPAFQFLEDRAYLPEGTTSKAKLGTDDSVFEWPEAFHMSPLEDARTLAEKARAIVNMSRRAQFGDPIVSDEECRTVLSLPEKVKAGDTMPKAPTSVTNPGAGAGSQRPSPVETPAATAPAVREAPDTRGGS
jgi:hypothetical protein